MNDEPKYPAKIEHMTKDELSLLIYLECCAVDYGGLVHCQRINDEEQEILIRWDKMGFISYSRITYKSLQMLHDKNNTSLIRLSPRAWRLAHQERKNRFLRMSSKSPYCDLITTKTKKSEDYD